MAAAPLFRDTNMASMTSCENTVYENAQKFCNAEVMSVLMFYNSLVVLHQCRPWNRNTKAVAHFLVSYRSSEITKLNGVGR